MHSLQQVGSLVLSSQVGVEDGGFASKVLKTRPVMINFRINKPSNVRGTEYTVDPVGLIMAFFSLQTNTNALSGTFH